MRLFVSILFLALPFFIFAEDSEFKMSYPYINCFDYSGPGHIEIQQGKDNQFFFKAPQKIRDKFSISFSNGLLKIEPKSFTDVSQIPAIPHVVLIVNQLQSLVLEGDNYVDIDSIKTDRLMVDVKINGSTMLEGNIHCERFALSMVGSSQVTVTGTTNYQTIYINGPGRYDGKGFVSDDTNVRIRGASSCLVNVRDNLSISIEGFGHVHYLGSPQVSKTIKGEGVVSPLTKEIIEQFEEKK